jgi:PKD repeat protein
MRNRLAALLPLVVLFGLSCDKGTPVAPSGASLSISVSPDRITARGTAEITVVAMRSNGNPVNPGTEVRLTTNLGAVPAVVTTDSAGVAKATLQGDGRVGTAKVTAASGSAEAVTAEVKVGSFPVSMSLQATPSTVPEIGGAVELLVLVRDDQGQPLPEASVNFSTQKGTLASGGSFLSTNIRGEARDDLTVTAADLQTVTGDTFQVKAETAGSGGGAISQSFTLSIQRKPNASFTVSRSLLTVVFTDTSTGNPTSWFWEFGDPGNNVSRQQNPSFTYPGPGTYLVRLTAANATGSSEATQFVAVTGN